MLGGGAAAAADGLVVWPAARWRSVSVLRPSTKPTAISTAMSTTAAAPSTILRGLRLRGALPERRCSSGGPGLAGGIAGDGHAGGAEPFGGARRGPGRGSGLGSRFEVVEIVDIGPGVGRVVGHEDGLGTAVTGRDARLFVGRVRELAAAVEPVGGAGGQRAEEDAVEARQLRTLIAEPAADVEKCAASGSACCTGGAPVSR